MKLEECSSPGVRSRASTMSYMPPSQFYSAYAPSTAFCNQGCYELAVCLCVMLESSLRSPPHEMTILDLRDTLAQKALNVMQKVIISISPRWTYSKTNVKCQIADCSPDHRRLLRVLIIELARRSERLPASRFLRDVRLENADNDGYLRFRAGGFADVYRGRYQRKEVALKVLRVFSDMDDSAQLQLRRVGDFLPVQASPCVIDLRTRNPETPL